MQRFLRPGDVLYDVGAHTGLFTLLGARLVGAGGQVVAFEPLPANLNCLRRHLALNRLGNVAIVTAAVGARPGRASFQPAGNTYMGRLADEGSITVDVTSLDATLWTEGLRAPNLIKIDVEGAEVGVLEGASDLLERHRPAILLATHSAEADAECRSRLDALGYASRTLAEDETELVCNPR
jgi:FkbM family methyltransferase